MRSKVDISQLASKNDTSLVQRSFGFVDLCGFCDFADSQGDDPAAGELGKLRQSIRETAGRFGVRIDKWLGDGAMLVGVENEALVCAVVAITEVHSVRGDLPLRAGVACGQVLLLEGDDYVGRPVNLAARLCDHALPGQVLASREGLRLPGWVEVKSKTTLQIRGFAEPTRVVALGTSQNGGTAREQRGLSSIVDGLTQPIRTLLGTRS